MAKKLKICPYYRECSISIRYLDKFKKDCKERYLECEIYQFYNKGDLIKMNKCLNCGIGIEDQFEVCSENCAKEYFEYVFEGEKYEDHPDFITRIAGVKEIN